LWELRRESSIPIGKTWFVVCRCESPVSDSELGSFQDQIRDAIRRSPRRTASMPAMIWLGLLLETKAEIPLRRTDWESWESTYIEHSTMAIGLCILEIWRATSSPSGPGMARSRTRTSGFR